MISVGIAELFILMGLFLLLPCLLITIWGIVDAANRPDHAW